MILLSVHTGERGSHNPEYDLHDDVNDFPYDDDDDLSDVDDDFYDDNDDEGDPARCVVEALTTSCFF